MHFILTSFTVGTWTPCLILIEHSTSQHLDIVLNIKKSIPPPSRIRMDKIKWQKLFSALSRIKNILSMLPNREFRVLFHLYHTLIASMTSCIRDESTLHIQSPFLWFCVTSPIKWSHHFSSALIVAFPSTYSWLPTFACSSAYKYYMFSLITLNLQCIPHIYPYKGGHNGPVQLFVPTVD